jgi:hypothetical protein
MTPERQAAGQVFAGGAFAPAPLAPLMGANAREKQIRGSGGSLERPGPFLMRLHTVCMEYSECFPPPS